jgi:hypothetical protein
MQGWRVSDSGQSAASASQAYRNLTSIVSVIDDPVRSAMLAGLAGGRALPAGELARRVGLQPRADSVLEAIGDIAPPAPVRSPDQERAAVELCEARTCYDHLAGHRVADAGAAADRRSHPSIRRSQPACSSTAAGSPVHRVAGCL